MSRPSSADRMAAIRILRRIEQHQLYLPTAERDALCHLAIASLTGERLSRIDLAKARAVIAQYDESGAAAADDLPGARDDAAGGEEMPRVRSWYRPSGRAAPFGSADADEAASPQASEQMPCREREARNTAVAMLAVLGFAAVLPGYLLTTAPADRHLRAPADMAYARGALGSAGHGTAPPIAAPADPKG